jgi:hypothetical protein
VTLDAACCAPRTILNRPPCYADCVRYHVGHTAWIG